jgi:hypothetical protein
MTARATTLCWIRTLRAFAAAVALVLVGGQLASVGHHVLVAHYLCATHQTLHHGEAAEHAAAAHAGTELAVPADAEDHGSHDDCSFPARPPAESLATTGAPTIAPADVSFVAGSSSTVPLAHDAIPLLSQAPKLSPPKA